MALLYTHGRVCAMPPDMYEKLTLVVDPDKSGSIPVSLLCSGGGMVTAQYNWIMQMQRWRDGKWVSVGTFTGYVHASSPSHRTFTNVGNLGQYCRIVIITADYYGNYVMGSTSFKK